MRRILIFAGLGLLLSAGLWLWLRPSHPPTVNASLYETDMVEGLVRELLGELKPPIPPVCFLAFGDGSTPPSREFISRFKGSRPALRSCGSAASPPVGRHFEISTGLPGFVIHIVEFREVVSWSFEVRVRFTHLPEGQDSFIYVVNKLGDEWKIMSRRSA